ncbi:MAG: Cof-type HAD-IIB family hydrolase [Lachnospiraceae bacterium]|nr:Cof-type HAD-IIB family hydrolase [Lachnospiraceae bacterium]
MKRKLLFTDLDGTLLSTDKTVSAGNLRAIEEMVKQGHKFVVATGRPIQSALQISEKYGWNKDGYLISSFNGGLIYDCGAKKDIKIRSMKKEDAKYILDRAHEMGIHAHTYDKVSVVSEYDTPELHKYAKGIGMPEKVVGNILTDLLAEPIKTVVISYEGRNRLKDFSERIYDFAKNRLNYTFSNPTLLEYEDIRASKGESLLFLADYYHIDISDTIAAGDEENDLSMIEAAGVGAVMANGSDKAREKADYITRSDNDHDGIAEIIERFIL